MAAMAMAMAGMMNGERAVVLLFITRVLFSLPFSLLSHGFALSLLALSALSLDILADSSTSLPQFSTRYAYSSLSIFEIDFVGALAVVDVGIIVISIFQAGCFVGYIVRGCHVARCFHIQDDSAFAGGFIAPSFH